jgi:hypothetical protein
LSPSETFPFSVEVMAPAGYPSEDALITVRDGHDEVRATGEGTVELDLPAGLYAIQVERAGVREEKIQRHDGPTTVQLGEPQRFSAVPSSDTATSHEYYEYPARKWSEATTAPALSGPGDGAGSLFLFLRAASSEAKRQPLREVHLQVADYSGSALAVLDEAATAGDDKAGWLAFHAQAPAGDHVLRYQSADGTGALDREMAVGVFAGWQTQVFMTLTENGPSFASASVLLGHGFHPDDRVAQAVDSALAGLQNGTDLLLSEERQMLLYGKFENPMLGLVGAHTLFQAPDPDRDVIDTVIGNLEGLLGPEAPDVRALRLIAARRFEDPVDEQPFKRPPMLRAGLEAVLEASAESPDLVPSGGVVADISVQRLVDSPWSTWKPLARGMGDWLRGYVQHAALDAARRDLDLDIEAVAARASVSLDSVADAYQQVRASMEPGPARTMEMERLVARARRAAPESDVDADEARRLFFEGDEGERVRTLGLMQGNPSLRDFDVALEGVRGSASAFEQYHALKLGQEMVPALDDRQREKLASAITEQRAPGAHISPGSDRWYLSSQVLSDLGHDPTIG